MLADYFSNTPQFLFLYVKDTRKNIAYTQTRFL